MTMSGIAYSAETQRMRRAAAKFARAAIVSQTPVDDPSTYFEQLLRAHREKMGNRQVQFLPHLCFPLPKTRDTRGMKYVLWRPVVLILELVFPIEVEDWMCGGEVGLVYLSHHLGEFIQKVYPFIERARRENPYHNATSALQLTANTLLDVHDFLAGSDPQVAATVDEMRKRFIAYIRNPHSSGKMREILNNVSKKVPDWAISTCVEFLRKVGEERLADDTRALASASETSLAHDWDRPEEEEVWSYLQKCI